MAALIDPQIQVRLPDGKSRSFAYEDVGAFLRFLEKDAKISEQTHVSSIAEKLFSAVDPLVVGAAKRASELASSVGERLLLLHMKGEGEEEPGRAAQIAEELNTSFYAHGDAVSRSRAKALGLKVADSNPDLEKIIWRAYEGIESYLDLRRPFVPLQHLLSSPDAAALVAPTAPLKLPPDTPPQLAQQLWQQVAQQAIAKLDAPGVEVEYDLVKAVLESCRVASELRGQGRMSGCRQGGEIVMSIADLAVSWRPVEIPA